MKDLLKQRLELWIRMRWLKLIHKEVAKRDRLYKKYKRSEYIISQLVKEYEFAYGDMRTGIIDVERREK
jgi:hypothetical protein